MPLLGTVEDRVCRKYVISFLLVWLQVLEACTRHHKRLARNLQPIVRQVADKQFHLIVVHLLNYIESHVTLGQSIAFESGGLKALVCFYTPNMTKLGCSCSPTMLNIHLVII